jgi:hypothetical protein
LRVPRQYQERRYSAALVRETGTADVFRPIKVDLIGGGQSFIPFIFKFTSPVGFVQSIVPSAYSKQGTRAPIQNFFQPKCAKATHNA